MISLIQVQLRKHLGSIKLDYYFVHGRSDVSLALYCFIGSTHVNTHSHLCWIFRFRYNDNRRYPWCWAIYFFYNIFSKKIFYLVLNLFSEVKRNSPMPLRHWFNIIVNVKLYFILIEFSNSFE